MDKDRYVPALGVEWLTSLYDFLISVTLPEHRFKRDLIEHADLHPGYVVLDLGCGTATLSLMLEQTVPNARIFAMDGDMRILELARKKAAKRRSKILFQNAMSFRLPYFDNSFHRVLSSLVFHHLTTVNKVRTFNEIFRVLSAGGTLHIADWGKPQSKTMKAASMIVQMFDGRKTTEDNIQGFLPRMLLNAGFEDVRESKHYSTIFGTLSLYSAVKP